MKTASKNVEASLRRRFRESDHRFSDLCKARRSAQKDLRSVHQLGLTHEVAAAELAVAVAERRLAAEHRRTERIVNEALALGIDGIWQDCPACDDAQDQG